VSPSCRSSHARARGPVGERAAEIGALEEPPRSSSITSACTCRSAAQSRAKSNSSRPPIFEIPSASSVQPASAVCGSKPRRVEQTPHPQPAKQHIRTLLGYRGRLGNRADRQSGRRTGGRSYLAYRGQLPLPDDMSAHSLPFRTRGDAGDTTINPRCGGGWRGRISGRGVMGDHRLLREGHRCFHGSGIGRRRSWRGDRAAEAARNRVEHALKFPSCQRLARVGGRARFALSTPTSAGWGRVDGGAPKFICRPTMSNGLFCAFFTLNP
jgi:hypothetical protein